jgi:hypothetical protein
MMLFTVYMKWIDGADRGREKAKLEAAMKELHHEGHGSPAEQPGCCLSAIRRKPPASPP